MDYGVYKRGGAGKGTGVAAHAPRGWGVFAVVILSRQDENTVSMFFFVSSSGGGPGSSGTPFRGDGT